MAGDGPRILLLTPRFRIVEVGDGNKVMERPDGCDALGVERWRECKFGDAETNARMVRDWIFQHLAAHPECGAQEQSQ